MTWAQWQQAVVAQLQAEFADLFCDIGLDDVDWHAWQPLYLQGRTPRAAIDRALERDL